MIKISERSLSNYVTVNKNEYSLVLSQSFVIIEKFFEFIVATEAGLRFVTKNEPFSKEQHRADD